MKNILVVDDDENIHELLKDHLTDYNIICTTDGYEALTMIKKYSPDLIITDIIMPKMEGLEFIRKVRANHNIPIIVMSGNNIGKKFLELSLKLGASYKLVKPFDLNELSSAIRNIIY